jgi:hypothetical protein
MVLRDRLRNPFVQQYFLEILIPLIGFFWFDWTLEIIALFYLVDQLASEFSYLRKLKSIASYQNMKFINHFLLSVFLFLTIFFLECFLLFHFFSGQLNMTENNSEILLQIKIFAIEEGWLLFPAVFLMYYLKDQFTFFMPRKFTEKDGIKFFRGHLISESAILILLVAGIALFSHLKVEDYLILIAFLVVKILFDFTIQKMVDVRTNK